MLAPRTQYVEVYINYGEPPRRADRLPGHLLAHRDDREQPRRGSTSSSSRTTGHDGAGDQRRLHLQVRSGRLRRAEADVHRIESDRRRPRRNGHGRQRRRDLLGGSGGRRSRAARRRAEGLAHAIHPGVPQLPAHDADRQLRELDRRPVVRRQPDRQRAHPERRRVRAQLVLPQGSRREAEGRPAVGLQLLAGGRRLGNRQSGADVERVPVPGHAQRQQLVPEADRRSGVHERGEGALPGSCAATCCPTHRSSSASTRSSRR